MRRAVIEDIYRGWLQELTGNARRTKKFKARVFHLVTLRLPVLSRTAGDAPVSHSPHGAPMSEPYLRLWSSSMLRFIGSVASAAT